VEPRTAVPQPLADLRLRFPASFPQFSSALSMAGFDFTGAQFADLATAYPSMNVDKTVCYRDFCDDVNAVFTKYNLEKLPLEAGACTRPLFGSTSAQTSHFWYNIHPLHPQTPPEHPLNNPKCSPIPQKALKLSRKVEECKPLTGGRGGDARGAAGSAALLNEAQPDPAKRAPLRRGA